MPSILKALGFQSKSSNRASSSVRPIPTRGVGDPWSQQMHLFNNFHKINDLPQRYRFLSCSTATSLDVFESAIRCLPRQQNYLALQYVAYIRKERAHIKNIRDHYPRTGLSMLSDTGWQGLVYPNIDVSSDVAMGEFRGKPDYVPCMMASIEKMLQYWSHREMQNPKYFMDVLNCICESYDPNFRISTARGFDQQFRVIPSQAEKIQDTISGYLYAIRPNPHPCTDLHKIECMSILCKDLIDLGLPEATVCVPILNMLLMREGPLLSSMDTHPQKREHPNAKDFEKLIHEGIENYFNLPTLDGDASDHAPFLSNRQRSTGDTSARAAGSTRRPVF